MESGIGFDLVSMMGKKSVELFHSIRHNRAHMSSEELEIQLNRMGEIALAEDWTHGALLAYLELKNTDMIRTIAERVLSYDTWDAMDAFEFLGDREGMFRVIMSLEGQSIPDGIRRQYFGQELEQKVYEEFKRWINEKGFSKAPEPDLPSISKMTYNLSGEYDLGIGIAKGGLFLAYLSNLFGLDTKIIEYHGRKKGDTPKWIDEHTPQELKGKKIIVFDNDVVSGVTTHGVLRELQQYEPERIDLALILPPIKSKYDIGTIASNIPKGYSRTLYPENIGNAYLPKIVKVLEQRLLHPTLNKPYHDGPKK